MLKKYEFILKNLDCANCANKIQNKISENEKFQNVVVNFNTLRLSYESENENKEIIKEIIQMLEPDVEVVLPEENSNNDNNSKIIFQVIRLILGIGIAGIGFYAGFPKALSNILVIIAYFILLFRTMMNAIKLFKNNRNIDENFLVTISCIGAYLVGEHMEGLMVIILYEIGKILEEKAINNTRKSISDLMNIRPEYANLKTDGETHEVAPEDVKIGEVVIVKQGEKIPLDGIVISGEANLDTSSLTGESALRKVHEDSQVLSGSINVQGILEVRVTEKYENSTVNRILELVENATDKKAKTETFVAKAAKIYTPIVLVLAIIVAVFLPCISNIGYLGNEGSIYRALIFLVISCPCAIAISVPLSYFSGIGKASKMGILIKGSDYLDALKDIKQVVFDKTGTLTTGEFSISNINVYEDSYNKERVLELICLGESFSNHPIAKSILDNYKLELDTDKVKDYEEISGKGIKYKIDDKEILVGNRELVETEKSESGTTVFLKVNEVLVGSIVMNDTIKPGTKETIKKLKSFGIKTRIFTGDNKVSTERVAKELNITDVNSEMLPTDKYEELEKILNKRENSKKVAFVGDGINDSPVLARADIGISMGGVGSQSAIEASDVVIMTDNISRIVDGIEISKKTCKTIKQNLIFAIGIKVLVLVLSALGIASMWQAIFADVGVTLITILNTLRILK